jgi:hypothetical protein
MLIMITLSPCELLTYAKKIILYMCKNHEERLLNELLNELQITESLNISLERTDTLPFYRFNYSPLNYPNSSNSASSTLSSGTSTVRKSSMGVNGNEHRGLLHTKRHHSGEDVPSQDHVAQLNTMKMRTSSQSSLSASFNDRISTEMDKGTDHSSTI